MTIVKVNATVKRGHVAFSFTKRGVAFSLTNGKHGVFVGVEGILRFARGIEDAEAGSMQRSSGRNILCTTIELNEI